MFFAGELKNFKTDPSNDEISKKKNSYSFDNGITSSRLKEDLLPLSDFSSISSENKTMTSTMAKQKLQLNSTSPFAQMQNAASIEKSIKRPYSKPCPKSKKKSKLELRNFIEDDRNLDNDLLGLVGSINTDKNLDSDSSNEECIEFNDTIILEDNAPIGQQSNICNDAKFFKEKSTPSSAFFNNSLKSYISTDGSKHQTFAVEKKKGVGLQSTVPVFKEMMPSSFSRNSSPSSISLPSSFSTENNIDISESSKCAKEQENKTQEDKVSTLETSFPSPIKNKNVEVCQKNKPSNYQSIYASMGLDEDLCDTDTSSTKVSNPVPIEVTESSLSPEKRSLLPVKIKTEKESSPDTCDEDKKTNEKNESLTVDGCHLSWTFEAESASDDGEEEDVPLLLLKNQKTTGVINSPVKLESLDLNHKATLVSDKTKATADNAIMDFSPSLFIKKELIEGEIISESEAVSSDNISLISNAKLNTNSKLFPVKIKPEPVDTEYFESHNKTNSLNSLESFNTQSSDSSSLGLPKASPKQKSKVSKSLKGSKSKSALYKLLANKNTSTSIDNSCVLTHLPSSLIPENASSDILNACSDVSKSFDSNKTITKKPKSSKKKKTAKKKPTNVIEKTENSPHDSTYSKPISSSSTDIVNNLTESSTNSKVNLNTNELSESSRKLIETIEAVVKMYSIETEEETETASETDMEKFSESIPDLETPANDGETNEILEKSAMNIDSSIIVPESQINSSKKEKRKREATEKDINIDENIPITLLIKRQKTDSDVNSTDSFLCTNVTNKSYTVESCSVLDKTQEIGLDEGQEISCLSDKNDIIDNNIALETPAVTLKIKKKKSGKKKKTSKKKKKQSSLSEVHENDTNTTFFSTFPVEELDPNLSADTTLEKSVGKKVKDNSLYSESVIVDNATDQSSQNTVYPTLTPCDEQNEEESLSSSSYYNSVSANVDPQYEINNLSSLAVQSKKKKRRPRNYGWYKKKKNKKDKEQSRKKMQSTDEVEIQNTASDILNGPLFAAKTPIVVIKNLSSQIPNIENNTVKLIPNTDEIENVSTISNNESLEQSPVTPSSKGKKRKRKQSRKKKSKVSSKDYDVQNENEETSAETSVTGLNEVSDNSSIKNDSLQNKLSEASERNSKNYSVGQNNNESNYNSAYESDSTVDVEFISESGEESTTGLKSKSGDSNVATNARKKQPDYLLNILEFEKEIASIDALLRNKRNLNANSNSLGQNTSEAIETRNENISSSLMKVTEQNSSEVFTEKSSCNTASSDQVIVSSSNITPIQSVSSIHIKQELIDSEIPVNQIENTSQRNPFRTAVSDKDFTSNVTMSNSNVPLVSIKKEKDVECQSSQRNATSNCSGNSALISNQIADRSDGIVPTENVHRLASISNSDCNAPSNTSQNSHGLDINSIGLSIKKEITNISSISPSIDWSTVKSKFESVRRYLSGTQSDDVPRLKKRPLELLNKDIDEIQILPKENVQKDIPVVQLSDDDDIEDRSNIEIRNFNHTERNTVTNKNNEIIKSIKTEKDNSIMGTGTSDSSNLISAFTFEPSDENQSSVDLSKYRTDVSNSNIACSGSYVSEDPIRRETNNQFIVRDKYIDEYFKHPFLPSLTSYKKRRNRSKIYERIDSKAWNLPLDEVESRLKHAENTISQFGKKLGDIVKLEKYPVSKSEVECYHRILGVAPSHKLLSKCYLTSNTDFLNNRLNKFELEANKATDLTVNDILEGITESKNSMCKNFNNEQNVTVFDRNCPSAETKNSFDSNMSLSSDLDVIPDITVEQSNISSLNRNEDSLSGNAFLTVQTSSLPCATNKQDASNNASNINNSGINLPPDSVSKPSEVPNLSFLQSDILANLNLPSKEEVRNILDTARSSQLTTFGTTDITPNCNTELNTTTVNASMNNESSLPSSYPSLASGLSSEVNTNISQIAASTNKVLDIINLPVMELRKILETAGSLPTSSKSNDTFQTDNINSDLLPANSTLPDSLHSDKVNQDGIWKNKETFEYNHTQSTPVSNQDSEQNTKIQEDNNDFSKSVECSEEQTQNENSDDEYVDNEPARCDLDDEKSDSSSPENEEPPPIPQYKSKWEKIMERKSQELKEKEKINELYLKDCVPVSSRLKPQNKKSNVQNKVSQSVDKKSENSEEKRNLKQGNRRKTNIEILNMLSKGKKGKQTGSKKETRKEDEKINKSQNNKTETESEQTDKSKETLKVSEKQKAKTNDAIPSKKESPSKKGKNNESGEGHDLFAPDKLVKTTSPVKKSITSQKSEEKSKSKRFYGNRVTNRGGFLTESNPTKSLTQMKIPKKKTPEITKKSGIRSDEYHSMIKSPDINIDLPRSSGKNFSKTMDNRKNSEEYRSPLENASSSVTSHFIRTKRMRDKQNAYFNARSRYICNKNNSDSKKSLLPTPVSVNDETVSNTNSILKSPPSYQEISIGQKGPLLSSPSSTSSHLPSESYQSNVDPDTAVLRQIMSSVYQNSSNIASGIDSNVLPNMNENRNTIWNNNQYNSPFSLTEPSVPQNINPQCSLPADSMMPVNNPFRSPPLIDSLNMHRDIDYRVGHVNNNTNLPFTSAAMGNINNNINLPFTPPTSVNSSIVDSMDPRRTALGLQTNVLMNSVMSCNTTSTDALDPRRAALGLQPNMPISTLSADPRRGAFTSQLNPMKPLIPTDASLVTTPLSEPSDPRKTAQLMHQSSSISSQILIPTSCIATSTSVTSTSEQPSRKATCLVPAHLKNLVGLKTIETQNVRLLMLEWSVDWLIQQQKMRDPPPISTVPFKKVTSSYDSFEDYYNTYFPLMLLETWHRIYVSWTHLNQTAPFLCQITSYSVRNHYVSVECQTVFSTDNRPKGVFPDDGSILMIKYSTKSNEYTIKILGYVTHVKTRRYNPVTDSKLCSSCQQKDVNPDSLQILTLTFMGAYNSEDIDKRQPVRIHVLCTVKHNLKQNDAMLFINRSPLQRIILNPIADGLITCSLTPRNSPADKVTDCVRDIMRGITSPHPLPLLTVVRAKPESDRLNIIPLLIEKMKTNYKFKVLLCVRTVRALGDIAANICLQQSLKLVIINKRCDTNLQFQKYLLDELVSCEVKKLEEEKAAEKNSKSDNYIKIKKQIIRECDVILSLIRNSHDDFLSETFHETDTIAQMCCIVDEANLCTEPETLIPILHGISKLILIGDPDYNAKVLSKKASAYDFNQSFFQRAYDLDLLTE